VLYHRLTPNDKFLVLATDGLWDFLDPDTVVRLINDHTFGTQTLSDYQPTVGYTLGEVEFRHLPIFHRTVTISSLQGLGENIPHL
jgi:hypothetical protein